ncbi:MAG: ATP-binding protein [Anaerolineae bacterium]
MQTMNAPQRLNPLLDRQFLRQHSEQMQDLYRQGAEAVATKLDRHCPYCGALLVPEIKSHPTKQWPGREEHRYAVYRPCRCPEAQAAAAAAVRAEEARQHKRREEARRAVLHAAGLTGHLERATFETYRPVEGWPGAARIAQRVRRFVDMALMGQLGSTPWLVMHGNPGTGKTHLAAAAIHDARQGGWKKVYYRSWTHCLQRLQASWNRVDGETRASEIVDRLQKGQLVAIDGIDQEELGHREWVRQLLFRALDLRYVAQQPTILVLAHAPDEPDPHAAGRLYLERYVPRAVLDRISGAAFDVIAFDGPSYRSGVRWKG